MQKTLPMPNCPGKMVKNVLEFHEMVELILMPQLRKSLELHVFEVDLKLYHFPCTITWEIEGIFCKLVHEINLGEERAYKSGNHIT